MEIAFDEIVKRSQSERNTYPDIFTDDCGLDSIIPGEALHAVPTWGRRASNMTRRVTLKVSTFRGISSNAIHFYGSLNIQGVYMEVDGEPGHGRMSNAWEREFPLSDDSYVLKLVRPVMQEDKDADKEARCEADIRFDWQDIGDLTDRFNTVSDLIDFAKTVFQARFKGAWELWVEYTWKSKPEKISTLGDSHNG